MLDVALVGVGAWGRRLVTAVQGKSERIRFTAAMTRTPLRVRSFAADTGIRLYDNLAELLGDPALGGVVVAGPADLHAAHARAAIEAGKHVLVIKPLALRRADAEALRAAAAARGVLMVLGYDRCFAPAIAALRRCVAAGDLGRILHVEGDFCVDRYRELPPNDWKTAMYRDQPGALADHMLYAMIELIGPVKSVSVQSLNLAAEHRMADTVAVTLRFADGTSGTLTALGLTPNFERLHFFGTRGWAEVRENSRFEFRPCEGKGLVADLPPADLLKQELECFAAAIAGEMAFPVSPENAVAGVAAIEAMARSAATGRPVAL